MKITITDCYQAPQWDTLQMVLREALNEPKGLIMRIFRQDGGVDYRDRGVYEIGFRQYDSRIITVVLSIE